MNASSSCKETNELPIKSLHRLKCENFFYSCRSCKLPGVMCRIVFLTKQLNPEKLSVLILYLTERRKFNYHGILVNHDTLTYWKLCQFKWKIAQKRVRNSLKDLLLIHISNSLLRPSICQESPNPKNLLFSSVERIMNWNIHINQDDTQKTPWKIG